MLKDKGSYDPTFERDACGVGLVANIKGIKSHEIIKKSLTALSNLEHRGASGADPDTGDGAGILIQIPHDFFSEETSNLGFNIEKDKYGTGIIFAGSSKKSTENVKKIIEKCSEDQGLQVIGWRDVPVNSKKIGKLSKEVMPNIIQVFIGKNNNKDIDNFEQKLFIIRKKFEYIVNEEFDNDEIEKIYACSLSAHKIIYKGLLTSEQVPEFYLDLKNKKMESSFGLVHSRFSTNTLGDWKLAHPYRFVAHNGEINTLKGNRNWMIAREPLISSKLFGDDMDDLFPICKPNDSDTASFDNVLELLTLGGRDLEHAMAMMIPESWDGHESMNKDLKDFYKFHSILMEPWDGPALIVCTDGKKVGAVLDRNGLRPFRYTVTKDGTLIMGSETGLIDINESEIEYRERLRPGRMFLIDFEQGKIIEDEEIKKSLAGLNPYTKWLDNNSLDTKNLLDQKSEKLDMPIIKYQQVFGYSQEDLEILIDPMSKSSKDPVGSMGSDTPIPILSKRPQNVFTYFKQMFAQVSNPPLDAIREKLVTQISVPAGKRFNILEESEKQSSILFIDNPLLSNEKIAAIKKIKHNDISVKTISTLIKLDNKNNFDLIESIEKLRIECKKAIDDGFNILILSDRGLKQGYIPIPSLLALSAVHHYLIRDGLRSSVDLIVESGEPREVHHFSTLFGYGASAINPYLAIETVLNNSENNLEAVNKYLKSSEYGLLKVMSKMGISTLQGYQGAQIFESLGLSKEFVENYFTWTPNKLGGIDEERIKKDMIQNYIGAFKESKIPEELELDLGGLYLWRGTGESHMWNPTTISLLQHSTATNDQEKFNEFEKIADNETEEAYTLRGLLDFNYSEKDSIPIEEVESALNIVKRFATGAISLGSISKEAHETLAVAMNRIGARSNTGEGGEDSKRFNSEKNSRTKQVASGRFGVTANYLVNSTDLQIKMAQGAKPGEGGQIPGSKISEYIGSIRKTTPGVELISPPPHHDIYSIEDLAQLIHDLKNINRHARIHVKLVSEAGVGIIAAGVAKAKGDVVLISGMSGGTGAAPLGSIRHAGLPWELGLAETNQVLVSNGLRGRIVVQTDGQMKTGRDVAIATLLGAEEWGIATAGLIVMGCIMLRKCHLNTCSVGVATQDPELTKLFQGTPEAVVNYFMFLAESLRNYMAMLGFRKIDEMVGRTDKLKSSIRANSMQDAKLDLDVLLAKPSVLDGDNSFASQEQDHGLDKALDFKILGKIEDSISKNKKIFIKEKINNYNRTVGSILSSEITKIHGESGLPEGTINLNFSGSAGQSFGAFACKGLNFTLEGDANDYFGKGLSGGKLTIFPNKKSTFEAEKNIIIGNVALYGATGGQAYIAGLAGERFCVRNSSALAVVEGIGDHGCEYMTGGTVVILGETGRNFGAGMSGGIAYVFDGEKKFEGKFNSELCDLKQISTGSEDDKILIKIVNKHIEETDSSLGKRMLTDWENYVLKFKKVVPRDYEKALLKLNRKHEVYIN
ncbi:MAG: glutamate synthase large subunit [Chloroflexi bacterium]|nr:glutamate synthase large subunit [Chloroflexota bacterium]